MGKRSKVEIMVDFETLKSKYSEKKVFLTGQTGFKGAWLLVILKELGAEVKSFALKPEEKTLYNLLPEKYHENSVYGDIRDEEHLEKEILDFQPDFIFHLAAQALVRKSYKEPKFTYETNVIGTLNLLLTLQKLQKKCSTVVITTDKVYENKEWFYPYRENDPLGGFDPYSSSKACAEITANSMRLSFFNPSNFESHQQAIATVRAGNVIGGGDWSEDRLIPDLVRAMQANKELVLRNPEAVRPWQHVLEPLFVYLNLGVLLDENVQKYSEAFNIGPGLSDTLTVQEVVEIALEILGTGSFRVEREQNAPHEAKLLTLDTSKTRSLLKWSPRWNAHTAIQKTIEWYKNHEEIGAAEMVLKQMKEYFN